MIDQIKQQLSSAGLGHLTDRIVALARPGVQLATQKTQSERLQAGVSRIGGFPDVGSGWDWPSWGGKRLAFLAQINLADLQGFPFCGVLPGEGLLQFFYDADQSTWGFDPKDSGSWLVHYEPNVPAITKTGLPTLFPARHVVMSEVQTLPPSESQQFEALGLAAEERDGYLEVLSELETKYHWPEHQVLGYPQTIQGDMQLECQLVSHGLYCGDSSGYDDPRATSLKTDAGQWRLLFQLGSDENAEMMWGDLGRLYFWITESALKDRQFEKCWMIMQCF